MGSKFGPILPRRRTVRAAAPGAALALVLGGCSSLPDLKELEIPANDPSFRTRVYAGASMGNSHLTPDTRGTVFNVDETDDLGTQLRLGVDVHNMLAVELDTSILGTATLREAGTDVNYSAASVSALVYGMNGVQLRSRREGWSAYGRVGLGILKKSSAVVALEEGGTVPILGIGAEYGLPGGLGIRGEITRFDEDAVYAGLGAVYRFGLTPRQVGGVIARVAEPVLSSTDTRVAEGGRTLTRRDRFGQDTTAPARSGEPALQAALPAGPWRPSAHPDDRDRDGVRDAFDRCPETGVDITVDARGCGLFDEVLVDVTFKSGSHWLTARARGKLDWLGERLLAFPEARVRVLAHTDSTGPADANLALSARRAEAVVQYLESRGVAELQLEALGLGETRPIASNRSPEGRRRNRRVEIETLANLDAERLAETATGDDRQEPVRWLPPVPLAAGTATSEKSGATDAAGDDPSGVPWRADAEPAVGAASPVTAAADAVAALVTARPTPLPRPGFVPGLAIGGVVPGIGFVSGSAELLPSAAPELARIAGELRRHPDARIAIMAHTDDQGREADNMALSIERAKSVRDRFVDLGIERTRLVTEGYGETLPLVQNVTEEDRARNRRVELRVLD